MPPFPRFFGSLTGNGLVGRLELLEDLLNMKKVAQKNAGDHAGQFVLVLQRPDSAAYRYAVWARRELQRRSIGGQNAILLPEFVGLSYAGPKCHG